MMEGEENSASPQPPGGATKIESLPCSDLLLPHPRKKKNKNKRRFSDEQIRSLESIFKTETKLEPRKKLQLARELGLQPRQIAIWFQNRRARWKSKQIEQDYRVLKANYDNLHSRFESLKKEKESLLIQLQKVSDLLGKTEDQKGNNSMSSGSDSEDTRPDFKAKPTCLNEGLDNGVVLYSDDEEGGNVGYFQQKEAELLNSGGQVDGSLALPERWSNLDSTGAFDQACGSSNWWEFWS